jgi:hypothetical protein
LGLGDDFYASLAQKEHAYTVMQRRISKLNTLRDYYKAKYGLELSLVAEPKLPCLYRMVFKKTDDES